MTNKSLQLTDDLYRYLSHISLREDEVQQRLRAETAELPAARMQIAPEQGQFMGLLARLINARRAIDVGVFTGYSSLSVALAMPDDGRLIACDVSERWTTIAQRYWQEAGVHHKIELRLAPALETLNDLLRQGRRGELDLAFIDADKQNYRRYYECLLELVRPGGLILIDNVLWSGRPADPAVQDADTAAIRALNEFLRDDDRIWLSVLPLADGLTLAMKKDPRR
jgi:predicted O-methyltransferase YrrM